MKRFTNLHSVSYRTPHDKCTTGVTKEAEMSYYSGTSEFNPYFGGVRIVES